MKYGPGRPAAILLSALAVAWLTRAAAAPTVTFELDPPNPVAGQIVRLRDTSPAPSTAWMWDLGDGSSASTASPAHAWSEPGTYTVRLLAQDASSEKTILVSPETTLRLLAAHPFEVTIDAKDPGTGAPSPAQAIAISDRFGWFSFPGLTHDPGNPEVTVKVLQAPTFGHYWVFWSAMTSLEYTMTVRDVLTGQVQVYEKTGPDPCGGWDTQSFPFVPTPTPSAGNATPTHAPPTSTPAPGQTAAPTRTPTRTRTPTPASTPTPTVTPTATPSGPTTLTLRAVSWGWAWCTPELPCTPGACGFPQVSAETIPSPNGPVSCSACGITLVSGCSYKLVLFNGDSSDESPYHTLNAHPEIGLPNAIAIPQGSNAGNPLPPVTITMPASPTDVYFSCSYTSCGMPEQHESMLGVIHVAP